MKFMHLPLHVLPAILKFAYSAQYFWLTLLLREQDGLLVVLRELRHQNAVDGCRSAVILLGLLFLVAHV